MKTPEWWQRRCLKAEACLPLAALWQAGTFLRQKLATPERMPVPVICVGNVVAGGGGKTPVALSLGEEARKRSIHAFFLSRGYGGSITKPTLVRPEIHHFKEVGDEPLLLARVLPTVIAKDRVHGAGLAVALGANMIIMDDGLQYPQLHKDISILVLKGDRPLGNGLIIPAGPLREPLENALERIDGILHLDSQNATLPSAIAKSGKPVWSCASELILPELPGKKVVAFAGIAYPQHFRKSLERAGLEVAAFYGFADHHAYTERELNVLIHTATTMNAPLLTTEKDWVRLTNLANYAKEKVSVIMQRYHLPPEIMGYVFK